ncbi:YhgE/Pip domain-containing protein [Oceanobacillus bengalensis]|uniref:YhgE/Pip domain-containing protein n=1 Tax=Oceanobacillus bengalensis TaxID=1435466 RepID=A0A494Z7Q0_9BACI|nr:YhgE/Pip domain-containing protein [Oceanobacillus bengalensis]RKQ18624.1 YhgE/Pip domain-containing protein [Oceanobacillus bengalensis]
MSRIKKTLFIFMAIVLVLPSFLVTAESNEKESEEETTEQVGVVSSKDEVVYATLSPSGEEQELYVVNNFEVEKAGEIVDYGTYSNLKNLTDLSEIKQAENTVKFTAPEGKFYYQGNIDNEPLPWDINISYTLDGENITPSELAGKDGHLELNIKTLANEQVDGVFYENYMLQISLTLDPSLYHNIEAPDGIIANAGKNKQITFTVMPEKDGDLSLEADVEAFELNGIDITAIPSSMAIDAPDMNDMTGDMDTLNDAIKEINDGVGELKSGVSDLNDGVVSLQDGSKQYKDGIAGISNTSSGLVDASKSIDSALVTMKDSIGGNSSEMDLGELTALPEGLTQIAKALKETATGLVTLKDNFATAYGTFDSAIQAIPANDITQEEIDTLRESNPDNAALEKLINTYDATSAVKEAYTGIKEGFNAVGPTLDTISGTISEIAGGLETTATELSSALEDMDVTESIGKLQDGLATLSSSYKEFHTGLVSYTGGVSELSTSYNELHAGIVELTGGTTELEDGVAELHDGTGKLYESTNDLPDQMQDEVDQMIAEYDKSDFDSKSFVSSDNNEKINTVQFVLKTESIQIEEPETTEEPVKEEKGFWDKLWDLF